jgi:hypothetical protein
LWQRLSDAREREHLNNGLIVSGAEICASVAFSLVNEVTMDQADDTRAPKKNTVTRHVFTITTLDSPAFSM